MYLRKFRIQRIHPDLLQLPFYYSHVYLFFGINPNIFLLYTYKKKKQVRRKTFQHFISFFHHHPTADNKKTGKYG